MSMEWIAEQEQDLLCQAEDYLKSKEFFEDMEGIEEMTMLLAAIETSLDPDSFAYIRLLFPDVTGVQVLPSYGVQDYDEAVKIVQAAYPDARIVDAYELGQEVERRQPDIEVAQEYFDAEF